MALRQHILRIIIEAQNRAQADLESFGSSLGQIGSIIAGGGLAIGLRELAQTAAELSRMAGGVERVESAFRNLSGAEEATNRLNALRTAARGTISDYDLMLSANRAMTLQVTQDTETMVQLMQTAIIRGRAMGLSTQQAFNDLVTGIGRMSPLILDNLGIMTGGEQVFEDYAQSVGKATDELTDFEKRQALVNKVLETTPDMAIDEGALSSWERLDASIDNLKASLGELVSSDEFITTVDLISRMATALDQMAEGAAPEAEAAGEELGVDVGQAMLDALGREGTLNLGEFFSAGLDLQRIQWGEWFGLIEADEAEQQYRRLATNIRQVGETGLNVFAAQRDITAQVSTELDILASKGELVGVSYTDARRDIRTLNAEWERGNLSIDQYLASLEVIDPALAAVARAAMDAEEGFVTARRAMDAMDTEMTTAERQARAMARAYSEGEGALWSYARAADGAASATNRLSMAQLRAVDAAGLGEAKDWVRDRADAQWEYNFALADTEDKLSMVAERMQTLDVGSQEYLDLALEKDRIEERIASEDERRWQQVADRREQLAEQQAQAIRSSIASIMQPTQVTDLDMAATRLGVYEDKWDEYIRRLRSAATDAESAWKHLIPTDILAQGEDAIKVWVAEQERLFYSGQFGQLEERGASPEIREQAIQGILNELRAQLEQEAALEAFQDEVYQRAIEAGMGGITMADVGAAMGQPALAEGERAAEAFAEGYKGYDMGSAVSDGFEAQLETEQARIQGFGRQFADWFADGLEEGILGARVKQTLIDSLIDGVADALGVTP